jgi:hypothetical protein
MRYQGWTSFVSFEGGSMTDSRSAGELKPEGRKSYSKPEILSRERLEALAVVCSPPSKATTIECPSGTITS